MSDGRRPFTATACEAYKVVTVMFSLFSFLAKVDRQPSRVVKNGSVVSILRVLTKRGGYGEKTGDVSSEIRSRIFSSGPTKLPCPP
jgi:hypothetical protein